MISRTHLIAWLNLAFRLAAWVLVGYWIAAFAVTHVPGDVVDAPPPFPHADKIVHAMIYAGLAFLAAAAWTWRRTLGIRQYGVILCGLSLYAAFDEALQEIPGLHRQGDPLDWLADTFGVVIGFAVFATAAAIARGRGLRLERKSEGAAVSAGVCQSELRA
jgi:VanZ family protein